jgi:hypothetical protein
VLCVEGQGAGEDEELCSLKSEVTIFMKKGHLRADRRRFLRLDFTYRIVPQLFREDLLLLSREDLRRA